MSNIDNPAPRARSNEVMLTSVAVHEHHFPVNYAPAIPSCARIFRIDSPLS